jgi:ATP-binding cassette, subfamily B, bacterial
MENVVLSLFSFIWRFLKVYKWKIYGICLSIIIASLLTVIDPFLLKILIDKISNDSNNFNLLHDKSYIILVALFVSLNIFGNLLWRVINYLSLKTFPFVRARVVSYAFSYLSLHSHQYFQDNLSGDLANKIQDIGKSIENIFEPIMTIMYIICTVLITTIIAYTISFYFSIAIIIWVILFVMLSFALSKNIIHYSKDLAEIKSLLSGKYVDSLMNIFNINIFARQKFEKNYLEKISDEVAEKDVCLRWKLLKLWAIQGTLCALILGVMIFILIYLRSKGLVTVGDFVFIVSITITVIHQVFGIAELVSRMLEQMGICNQAISKVFATHTLIDSNNSFPLKVEKGEIIFKDVSFGYNENNILFDNLNIRIASNQKIGLVGYSGGGKTSLVNLLIRLYDVQKGEIRIDQTDIKNVTISSLRENITFIPQNPILFHRSFFDNIRYGNLDATDAEVIEAAKKAHAHEFIINTYNSYESMLGENGTKISGGQRQRVAIARAILKNSPILILDEATSSLDSLTEELIQDSLKYLMQNKTVITIAHRLSTLVSMDRILVFDKGRIVEDGTHNELLNKTGLYYRLWNSQVGGFLKNEP